VNAEKGKKVGARGEKEEGERGRGMGREGGRLSGCVSNCYGFISLFSAIIY